MIKEEIDKAVREIIYDPTVPPERVHYMIVSIISELEEEITALREKVERLEYHLGLTGLENDDGSVQ